MTSITTQSQCESPIILPQLWYALHVYRLRLATTIIRTKVITNEINCYTCGDLKDKPNFSHTAFLCQNHKHLKPMPYGCILTAKSNLIHSQPNHTRRYQRAEYLLSLSKFKSREDIALYGTIISIYVSLKQPILISQITLTIRTVFFFRF